MLVLGMVGRAVVELVVVGLLRLVIGLVVVGRSVVELVVKMKRSLVGGVHVFVGGDHVLAGGVHVLVVDSKTLLNFIDGRGVGWFARSAQSAGVLILFLVSFSPMVFTSKSLNNIHISNIFIVAIPTFSNVTFSNVTFSNVTFSNVTLSDINVNYH
jgi:hypothetical protein